MADPAPNSSSTAQSQSDTPNPSIPVMTLQQFAAGVKQRRPELQSIPDEALVQRVLQTHPDLTQHVIIGEPRRKPLRDRTPTVGQQTQKFFENHPKLREGALAIFSGLGVPETKTPVTDILKGLGQTADPRPQSEDEQAWFAVGVPLPAYRLAKGIVEQTYGFGNEAWSAIDWKKFIAEAKQKPVKKGLLGWPDLKTDSAPQFVHGVTGLAIMLATALVGSRDPEAGIGRKIESKLSGAARTVSQDIAGAGEEKVIGEVREHGGRVQEREAQTAETQAAHEQATADARREWVEKAAEARGLDRQQARIAGQREAIASGKKSITQRFVDNVKRTHDAVRGKLNERWEQLREAVGKDATVRTVDAEPEVPATEEEAAARKAKGEELGKRPLSIFKSIENARASLAGVPPDVTIFNQIIKEITEPGEAEGETGAIERVPKETIPFDDARKQFSALGEKAYAASGNLRRALLEVYDAYDRALNDTASAAGQGSIYKALKKDWSSYMHDWHDMSQMKYGKVSGARDAAGNVIGSKVTPGSPLARALRATLPQDMQDLALGRYSDPLFALLARYKQFGADPNLMAVLKRLQKTEESLPKPTAKERAVVAGLEPRGEGAPIRVPPKVELPAAPKPKAPVPPVDAFRIRLQAIEKFSGAPQTFFDWAVPWRIADKLLLKNKRFKEWVASNARPSDPDYVPPEKRGPMAGRGDLATAAEEVKKLNGGGMSALKDYFRGAITRDGFKQRLQALFPDTTAAEIEEIAAHADKSRRTATGVAGKSSVQ